MFFLAHAGFVGRYCKVMVGFPGFHVEFGGVGELNAAFLKKESRTRLRGSTKLNRKSGYVLGYSQPLLSKLIFRSADLDSTR
jgi:hypothetical protein